MALAPSAADALGRLANGDDGPGAASSVRNLPGWALIGAWLLLPLAVWGSRTGRRGAAIGLRLAPLVGLMSFAVLQWLFFPGLRERVSLAEATVKGFLYWPCAVIAVGGSAGLFGAIGARVLERVASRGILEPTGLTAIACAAGTLIGVGVGGLYPLWGVGQAPHWIVAGGVAGLVSGRATARAITGGSARRS
jgi:hypothetical protein